MPPRARLPLCRPASPPRSTAMLAAAPALHIPEGGSVARAARLSACPSPSGRHRLLNGAAPRSSAWATACPLRGGLPHLADETSFLDGDGDHREPSLPHQLEIGEL